MPTVATPLLEIAYEASGPPDGPPAILRHGWPDDVRTWDGVVPALAAAGWRCLVPWLRGFGPTRFRLAGTMRSGQLAALGQDLLDFADALGLDRFTVIGHDWGARAAYIAAALAPERVSRCVAISVGWGTNDPQQPLSLKQSRNYWYHWFMALERGAAQVKSDGRSFARIMWETWSPPGWFSDAAFETTARAFDNLDWPAVTLHSYRHRWGHAYGDPAYADLERRLTPTPTIAVPTLVIHGAADGANDPVTSAGRDQFFTGRYERLVLDGIGHFPPREAPDAVAQAILQFAAA
jgi:pimeloyl-ACP methyl ester carboxylesterase